MAKKKVFVEDWSTRFLIVVFYICLAAFLFLTGKFFNIGHEKIGLACALALIMYNLNLTSVQLRYRSTWFNTLIFFACFLLVGSQNRPAMTDAVILYFFTVCVASTHAGYITFLVLQAQHLLYLTEGDPRYFH